MSEKERLERKARIAPHLSALRHNEDPKITNKVNDMSCSNPYLPLNAALHCQPDNIKAMYRRAVALQKLGDLNEALIQAQKGQELDPKVHRVRAILFYFDAQGCDELGFRKEDIIKITQKVDESWWRGELNGHEGMFPVIYVERLPDDHH